MSEYPPFLTPTHSFSSLFFSPWPPTLIFLYLCSSILFRPVAYFLESKSTTQKSCAAKKKPPSLTLNKELKITLKRKWAIRFLTLYWLISVRLDKISDESDFLFGPKAGKLKIEMGTWVCECKGTWGETRFDLVFPSIIRTIHYHRILYHRCLDCAIKMASGKASLAFDSNYQQVFQYPLQYIPTNPINVCAVILDSLSGALFSTPYFTPDLSTPHILFLSISTSNHFWRW